MDYKNGKVYKLVSPSGLVYVGSTCQPLAKRKAFHKKGYIRWKAGKHHYVTSYKLFDESLDDIDIVLLEEFPCETKEQLHARERYFIDCNDCVNKVKPGRTTKEWRNDNKEEYVMKRREYLQKNKEKIADQMKEYSLRNKETISNYKKDYYKQNKDKIIEYIQDHYEKNKEKIADYHREYYEKNKQKYSVSVDCDCGSTVRKRHLLKHTRTSKHKQWTELQNATS